MVLRAGKEDLEAAKKGPLTFKDDLPYLLSNKHKYDQQNNRSLCYSFESSEKYSFRVGRNLLYQLIFEEQVRL